MSTNTSMFPGSRDVYIQFHDILGTPMFTVLQDIIYGKTVPGLYNTGFLGRIPLVQQIQWYITRTKFNFLQIPGINVHGFTDEENDRIMLQLLSNVSYNNFAPVNLLRMFMIHPLVEHLHIYSAQNEQSIGKIANQAFKFVQSSDYRYGDFRSIIRDARQHATLVTTSTKEARIFLDSEYKTRYVSLIYPNGYDSIQNISDIYSKHSDQIGIIDIRRQVPLWKETVI